MCVGVCMQLRETKVSFTHPVLTAIRVTYYRASWPKIPLQALHGSQSHSPPLENGGNPRTVRNRVCSIQHETTAVLPYTHRS
uniref:Uncharacterized protein n=1 Tax=Rhizophora mucronata TaxID=61149 RepID=A0A2P2QK12_RHIMU